jgi:hypothetical protein
MHYDISLENEYAEYIDDSLVKQAHKYIVDFSKNISGYTFFPKGHGDLRDYRYMKNSAWYYALAVNKKSLVLYFRKPSLSIPTVSEQQLVNAKLETTLNPSGEIKVKIYNPEQAKTLMHLVFHKT